jgi:hypothetical protein
VVETRHGRSSQKIRERESYGWRRTKGCKEPEKRNCGFSWPEEFQRTAALTAANKSWGFWHQLPKKYTSCCRAEGASTQDHIRAVTLEDATYSCWLLAAIYCHHSWRILKEMLGPNVTIPGRDSSHLPVILICVEQKDPGQLISNNCMKKSKTLTQRKKDGQIP